MNGQVVIVTGGTQGLGECVAKHLVSLGARGIVICGRNRERGKRISADLSNLGGETLYVEADLANVSACRDVVRACDARFGRVDALVNSAATTVRGTLDETTAELWDYVFALNSRAPFILTQECVRIMKRENIAGSIVNVLSKSSYGGQPFLTAYSASKAALANFTKNTAHALRYDKVRVNGINLGSMDTPAERQVRLASGHPKNWLEKAEAQSPFGRLLRPLDVAKLIAYLLGPDAEMMTGAIIDFDQKVMGAYG